MPQAVKKAQRDLYRLCFRLQGQVQGVGFRPFVHRIADQLGLTGWVRNDATGVHLEVQGPALQLAAFEHRLHSDMPPLARIVALERSVVPALGDEPGFVIGDTVVGASVRALVSPDTAVCEACLAELFDPQDHRYRYPFINCTHCGPRYTLIRAMPYDRSQTTMASFAMCSACEREYHGPSDRRFHAQPNACASCGPTLSLCDAAGVPVPGVDPLAETWQRLAAGEIIAIKGLGGFHLACDARNPAAVARLRERKRRGAKPFALMALNAASLAAFTRASPAEVQLLESPERPIVVLEKGVHHPGLDAVAPDLNTVGVMLPFTPLHYLLFHEAASRPEQRGWLVQPHPLWLVMTSANARGEPLVKDNVEAMARLQGIADAFLVHDRDIAVRCDDSVLRVMDGTPVFLRRARGYAPRPVVLPTEGRSVVAFGAFLKSTLCLTREREAFVSQYLGNLDSRAACSVQDEILSHLIRLLDVEPEAVACDLHPDFPSTRLAARYAKARGLPLVQVQHHHAHAAAVAAEHGLTGPFLALTLDGVGFGSDGQPWGGELLRVDGAHFKRLGHLRPLALPGGDRAVREPWRVAAGVLHELGRGEEIERRWSGGAALRPQLERRVNVVYTSSAGRLFDAAAGLLGVCETSGYEAEAAMRLEALAGSYGRVEPATHLVQRRSRNGLDVVDCLALLEALANETNAARGAALFHASLAEALACWVADVAQRTGLGQVALTGGCFLNGALALQMRRRLELEGLAVYTAREVSPGDEGVSLGQAWVVLQRLNAAQPERTE